MTTTTFTLTDATGTYDWMLESFIEPVTRQDVIDVITVWANSERDQFEGELEDRAAQLRYPTFDGIEDEHDYIAAARAQMLEDIEAEKAAALNSLLIDLRERGLLIETPEPDGQGGGAQMVHYPLAIPAVYNPGECRISRKVIGPRGGVKWVKVHSCPATGGYYPDMTLLEGEYKMTVWTNGWASARYFTVSAK